MNNRNFERLNRRDEKYKRKELSQEFDENKMSDASAIYEDKNTKITPSMYLVL